jgi:hypothetical protein
MKANQAELISNLQIAADLLGSAQEPVSQDAPSQNVNLRTMAATLKAVHASDLVPGGLSFHFMLAASSDGASGKTVILNREQVAQGNQCLANASIAGAVVSWNRLQFTAASAVAAILDVHREAKLGMRDDVIADMQAGRFDPAKLEVYFAEPDAAAA